MFIVHLTLQGCYRPEPIDLGVTADTGGHLTFIAQLAHAQSTHDAIDQVEVITRKFHCEQLSYEYSCDYLTVNSKLAVRRLRGSTLDYLPKEELHRENGVFAKNLIRYLESLTVKPDLIHAHYCDAGYVAHLIEKQMGIKYVFTPHSLASTKMSTSSLVNSALYKRWSLEQIALENAARIIVSSSNEVTHQLGCYKIDQSKVSIIAPGCDSGRFKSTPQSVIDSLSTKLDQQFQSPDKPVILALARPVLKKNLVHLLTLYARSQQLQDKANLLIVAGQHANTDLLSTESKEVIDELKQLIATYELQGKVLLPSQHDQQDIPAYYRYAADRRGVFVNLALNEPFGLTILESAASGLPVLATNQGGAADILASLQNGISCDPSDSVAATNHLINLTGDSADWRRFAQEGLAHISQYSWLSYVDQFIEQTLSLRQKKLSSILLISDIDNTLTGSSASALEFNQLMSSRSDIIFGVATGRDLEAAQAVLKKHAINLPKILITSVGSEIYYNLYGQLVKDSLWDQHIDYAWQPALIKQLLSTIDLLQPQEDQLQRTHKLGYYTEEAGANAAKALIEKNQIKANVIYSHNKLLDILPIRADKAKAIEFVRSNAEFSEALPVVAGDSGNDLSMLSHFDRSIVVANHEPVLSSLKTKKNVYFSKSPFAKGVLEGIRHFELRT